MCLDARVPFVHHAPMPAHADWIANLAGRFIVFDGPDGSGKSTQFRRFATACRENGLSVCEVREPGGTHIGEQIRQVLLDPANQEMSLRCEMMLYMASRAQLIEQTIRPALKRRELVLADQLLGSTPSTQVVHQCGSGVSACSNLLAMEIAGLQGSRLYPGSWSEWVADPARPIATS
jgi:dTMP kinase